MERFWILPIRVRISPPDLSSFTNPKIPMPRSGQSFIGPGKSPIIVIIPNLRWALLVWRKGKGGWMSLNWEIELVKKSRWVLLMNVFFFKPMKFKHDDTIVVVKYLIFHCYSVFSVASVHAICCTYSMTQKQCSKFSYEKFSVFFSVNLLEI